jgi:hypothetical protein
VVVLSLSITKLSSPVCKIRKLLNTTLFLSQLTVVKKVKIKLSHYRPAVAQRVLGR